MMSCQPELEPRATRFLLMTAPPACLRFAPFWIGLLLAGCLVVSGCNDDTPLTPPPDRTEDAWTPFTNGLPRVTVRALARDPSDNVLYAGTASTATRGGLFRSTDDGATWSAVAPQPGFARGTGIGTGIDDMAVGNGALFVATKDVPRAVERQPAPGASWEEAANGLSADASVLDLQAHQGTLFAGTSDGLYRWSGAAWARIPFPVDYVPSLATDDERLYAVAQPFDAPDALYATDAASAESPHWQRVSDGLDIPPEFAGFSALYAHQGALYAGFGEAGQPARILRLDLATDTWEQVHSVGGGGESITAFHGTPHGLYAGTTSSGVVHSTDGHSWTLRRDGLHEDSRFVFALTSATGRLVAGTFNGPYVAPDPPGTSDSPWRRTEGLPVGAFAYGPSLLALDGDLLFGITGQGVMRSPEGNADWHFTGDGLPRDATVHTLVPVDGTLFAAVQLGIEGTTAGRPSGVFRSTDGGHTWIHTSGALPSTTQAWDLAEADGTLYVATERHGVWRSADRGGSWTNVTGAFPQRENGVERVRSVDALGDVVLAGVDGSRVWRSPDRGATWTAVPLGDDVRRIHALLHVNDATYAATNAGLFRSTDTGQTWTAFSEGLPTVLGRPGEVDVLHAADGLVLAGTRGNGVYRLDGTRWRALGPSPATASTDGPALIDTVPVDALALTKDALYVSLRDDGIVRRARPLP